ncbi:hypothetical protein T654_04338 [Escherichia coli K02]|nr:hypothetical protein T654_04338 [Escherichia coli K02]
MAKTPQNDVFYCVFLRLVKFCYSYRRLFSCRLALLVAISEGKSHQTLNRGGPL